MSDSTDRLREALQQLAQRNQGSGIERLRALAGSSAVLASAAGANGVAVLTEHEILLAVGKGTVQRTAEVALADAIVTAERLDSDLLVSLVVRSRDPEGPTWRLQAAGDTAERFADAFVQAQAKAMHAAQSKDWTAPLDGTALIVQVSPPGTIDQIVSLLERLGQLRQAGLLSDAEYERCKVRVLGESEAAD
jgi:hypothetical protein